jgi:hypothetical protein
VQSGSLFVHYFCSRPSVNVEKLTAHFSYTSNPKKGRVCTGCTTEIALFISLQVAHNLLELIFVIRSSSSDDNSSGNGHVKINHLPGKSHVVRNDQNLLSIPAMVSFFQSK